MGGTMFSKSLIQFSVDGQDCFLPVVLKVKVAQLCPTLCNPTDYTAMEFSRPAYWSGLPLSSLFPSPVDHVLSELSTMTCPSWVALHSMAHSFIELDKAVVHVISLVTFL